MTDPFDLEDFLPYRMNRAAEMVSLGFKAVYRKERGMTRPEWRVLALVGATGGMTATEIASRSNMHKTKVSRAVAALEQRGWLERRDDVPDRRVEHLRLTPAGEAAVEDLSRLARNYADALRVRIGPAGLDALDAGLAAIEAALGPARPKR